MYHKDGSTLYLLIYLHTNKKEQKTKLSFVQPLNLRLLEESYKVMKLPNFSIFCLCWVFFIDFRLSKYFLIFVQFSIFPQCKIGFFIRSLNFYFSFLHWTNKFLNFHTSRGWKLTHQVVRNLVWWKLGRKLTKNRFQIDGQKLF